jgi:hypothetical protein
MTGLIDLRPFTPDNLTDNHGYYSYGTRRLRTFPLV